jgi:hypothetical protein
VFDPRSHIETEFSLILRLDSFTDPGISEAQFRGLFSKCHFCNLYMTRRTANYHDCKEMQDDTGAEQTILLDLTGDVDADLTVGGSDD